jgi:ankyrin repeat protein
MSYLNNEHSIKQDLKTLGLDSTKKVEHNDIKKAFRDVSLKFHPDKQPMDSSESEKDRAKEQFEKIGNANDRLLEKCPKGKTIDPNSNSGSRGFGFDDFAGFGFGSSNKHRESNSGSKRSESESSKQETVSEKATREMKQSFSYSYTKTSEYNLNEWIKNGADVNAKDSSNLSMLMLAVKQENTVCVKILLKNGAKVNYKDFHGESALWKAVNKALLDITKLLIENGAPINEAYNIYKETVLIKAVRQGNSDIVKYLLENNANIDFVDFYGKKAIHYNTHNNVDRRTKIIKLFNDAELLNNPTKAMLHAFKTEQEVPIETLQKLIKAGAKLNAIDEDGNNVLILASAKGNARCVKFLTQDSLVKLNEKNKDGDTALRVAANNGHQDIVERLIERGADIDATNEKGHTALIGAACQGHLNIVKMLLKEDAKTDITGTDGNNLKTCARSSGNQDVIKAINELDMLKNLEKPLLEALKNREELDINFVKKILSEKSFDIEYKNENGENALFLASNHHHYTDIVKLLISKGANVNALTNEHKTPLMNAACSGLKGIVEMLVGSGAKTDITATNGLTIKKCSEYSNSPDVLNLIKEYSNYEHSKVSSNEALISAVNKVDKQAAQEIVKEQVHQILSHDHYAKVALDDVKQVFESEHLHQLNDELIAVQSCLLGLSNDYYDNLESTCAMSS